MNTLINRSAELLTSRIAKKSLHRKIVRPEDCHSLLNLFQDGQYMGWSGFAGTSYPKLIPTMLADHVEKNGLQGKMKFNLFVGASAGVETEDRWAKLNMIERRYPHQTGKNIRAGINEGRIKFADEHLAIFANELTYGFYTMQKPPGTDKKKIDIVIVEATEITEDGGIVPGASVGITPEILDMADKIIIEINTTLPSFKGIHDLVTIDPPPYTKPLFINRVDDRIGKKSYYCDPDKIVAIVESQMPDMTPDPAPEDKVSNAIAENIVSFFMREIEAGRLPKNLLPLQSGIGSVANAVIGGLSRGPFNNLTVWTEVVQDTFLDFFDNGKLKFASATSLRFSQSGFARLFNNWDTYKSKMILRNQSVSNAAEMVRRLGVIAMNTPVEFDIYGHVNSTCVDGSKMLNGLGGSGEFLRNSYISIIHAPSVRPSKTDPLGISSIVPFCSHVDHTEHDVDIFVTEQGLADVRGLSPNERCLEIINKCAHPAYRPLLLAYHAEAYQKGLKSHSIHEPHMLEKAFKFHTNFSEKGTMRFDKF